MLALLHSGAVRGVDATEIDLEVNIGHGDPHVTVVGLPDAAVKESSDRVWTALVNSGYFPPKGRTTVNLAPADLKKEGPAFDLAIALGQLAADGQLAAASYGDGMAHTPGAPQTETFQWDGLALIHTDDGQIVCSGASSAAGDHNAEIIFPVAGDAA